MSATERLAALGLTLPPPLAMAGNFVPFRVAGNLLLLSGAGPRQADGKMMTGKIGAALTVGHGYEAAKLCGLNLLANMAAAAGTLDRVDSVLRVFGMVYAADSFGDHAKVLDGCIDLFVAVFGEFGRPARSAVGVASMPRNISVQIEATVLLKN